MKLWIVTIGSSDVQLDSDKVSREKKRTEKQRSNAAWKDWYYDVKTACYGISFVPKTAFPDIEETYRIPSRVLGTVYQENSAEVQKEIWSYLTFPLLEQFTERLKSLGVPDAIAYLLTDQSARFDSDEERRKPRSPYWDDTCKLESILQGYFSQEYPAVKFISLKVSPPSEYGLDDWNKVLGLVKDELKKIPDELKKIQLDSEPDTVYVSHQAGTPAISSAVQFVSLGKFAEKVQFLVSNEYEKKALEPIKSSKYLKEIKFGQAKELLKNHDYAAVKSLLNDLDDETQILLDAAIQWNYAKFDDFAKKLQKLSDKKFEKIVKDVNERSQQWWWTAYESSYLAVVRLKQKNTVEAIFHSFRAVEGLLYKWVQKYHSDKLQTDSDGKETINYSDKTYNAYGKGLYWFFKNASRTQVNDDLSAFGNDVFKERNQLFHQIEGKQDSKAVFDFWKVSSKNEPKWKTGNLSDEQKWQNRVLGCLNCISGQKLTLEKASLMTQVHQKLEDAIASY